MFKNYIASASLIIGMSLANSSFASTNSDTFKPEIFAAVEKSSVLLPAQTQESAIRSFEGLDPIQTMQQLAKTQSCYLKECFIKREEVRKAYRTFFMDEGCLQQYLAGHLPEELPSLLKTISMPDYVEATTLAVKGRTTYDEALKQLIGTHKSLIISLIINEKSTYAYVQKWDKNDESYSEKPCLPKVWGLKELPVSLFPDSYSNHYLNEVASFDESTRHLAVLLRADGTIYHSGYKFVCELGHDGKETDAALSGLHVFIWLWSLVTQRQTHNYSDYQFLGTETQLSIAKRTWQLPLHKISYWLYHNISLAPTDVNKQSPLSINPDFFKKHPSVPFTPHTFVDMVVKLTKQTQLGEKADAADIFWLACVSLQLKDSFIMSQGPHVTGKPKPHFIGYMKVLYQMFDSIAATYNSKPLAEEVCKEAGVIAGNLAPLLPLMEDMEGVLIGNPEFVTRLSPQVRMFIEEYLIQTKAKQLVQRTPQEQEIADSLL